MDYMNPLFSLTTIAFIFIWHFFADFTLQTEFQAINKSKMFKPLVNHVSIYSLAWLPPLWYVYGFIPALSFAIITFGVHLIQDYITSKVNTLLLVEAKKTYRHHEFFVSVGLDQVLHYLQLFFTWYLIFGR